MFETQPESRGQIYERLATAAIVAAYRASETSGIYPTDDLLAVAREIRAANMPETVDILQAVQEIRARHETLTPIKI